MTTWSRWCGGVATTVRLPGLGQIVEHLESAEREAVTGALRAAGGNRSRAAAALGIGRNTLYRKMREFGIT